MALRHITDTYELTQCARPHADGTVCGGWMEAHPSLWLNRTRDGRWVAAGVFDEQNIGVCDCCGHRWSHEGAWAEIREQLAPMFPGAVFHQEYFDPEPFDPEP